MTDTDKKTPSEWMKGKQNRMIDDKPRKTMLNFRVTPEMKERYTDQAKKEGVSFAAWAINALDKACEN